MIRAKNAFAAPLFAIVLLLVLAAAAQANTIAVNDTGDPSGSGDCLNGGQCSLRQAVSAASDGDTRPAFERDLHPSAGDQHHDLQIADA